MKVFLSSTAVDLVAYRQVADDTILRLSQQAVVMERFGPLPGTPVDECERLARESDVLICMVAHRYGFIPKKGRGSITQREVKAAKKAGKDVLVWIVADDYPWRQKREQDLLAEPTVVAYPEGVTGVAAGVAALIKFKAWLRKTFTCDTFTTPDDLGRKIALALSTYCAQRTPSAAARAPKRSEIRIVHALQPAPQFHGRDALVKELTHWVADSASPHRVWALVAAGGTGKTAIVERVVREMRPDETNVLVWSFYEQPEADAFLRECNHLFLGEEDGPAAGRLERLERSLRDGRPHLIVLDGLERVQEDAGSRTVRGQLSDQTLKLLLRVLAAGLGRARALVTSRYSLVDLRDWENRSYREIRLDDLSSDAAVAVLHGWGVVGDESSLRAAAAQVGHHALSVAVLGSYLHSFAEGRIEGMSSFDLDAVTGDDPKAAKLGRVLAFYAERLPPEERELMTRASVFPRGVSVALLKTVVAAGGAVAGLLVDAAPRLALLLARLKARGLVFESRSDTGVTWTAHPFLREKFRHLLRCPAEQVFDVVAQSLGSGLEKRPQIKPSDPRILDRYERLIEATWLAGHEQTAVDLFFYGLGGLRNLGSSLGEYQRAYRVLASFNATGRPEDLGKNLVARERSALALSLSHFAGLLGRLSEASAYGDLSVLWMGAQDDYLAMTGCILNSAALALDQGRLPEFHRLAVAAVRTVQLARASGERECANSLIWRANAAHVLGDVRAARADVTLARSIHTLSFVSGSWPSRHHVDVHDFAYARGCCQQALKVAHELGLKQEVLWSHSLLARIELAEGNDPSVHLSEIRRSTGQTGEMSFIIEAHLLTSRALLASGDLQAALDEADTGLLHARACGYGLLHIELLVAIARIRLAWPDPLEAIEAARESLDLATDPDCQYAWGEADAAQVWGEAYFANHEPALAHRAFTQALAVRKRIEHPGVADTEKWLAMTAV